MNRTTQTTNNNKRIETKRPTTAIPTAPTQRTQRPADDYRPTGPCWRARCEKRGQAQGHIIVDWWRRKKRLENVTQKLLRLYKSIMDYVFAVLAKFYVSRIWVATMQTEKSEETSAGEWTEIKGTENVCSWKSFRIGFARAPRSNAPSCENSHRKSGPRCRLYRSCLMFRVLPRISMFILRSHCIFFDFRIEYSAAKFIALPGQCCAPLYCVRQHTDVA